MHDIAGLLYHIQRFKKVYGTVCRPVMKKWGLTRNEMDVLLFLANNPSCDTAKEVSELRALSKSQVCLSVDSLIKRGFLKGIQDVRDRRCIHLTVEPPAGEAVRDARNAQQQFLAMLHKGITEEERNTMIRVFKKMTQNMEGVQKDDN